MKVLVIGGGGREHAIIMKLAESKKITELHCAPGNGGISKFAICHPTVKATDLDGVKELAKSIPADFVVVAPDDPLVLGMVDFLEAEGFKTFGPKKAAAFIEGSKAFSKELMKKYDIPTAGYELFSDSTEAVTYIKENNKYPIVIKADGLALGKGVIIAENFTEAQDAVKSIIDDKIFGASGSKVVIEEFLTGIEVSVLCFTDGKTIAPMVSSMDHKRAYDNDEGLNTGGMGTIAPSPCYTEDNAKEAMDKIFIPTINAMKAESRTFKGCLYFGLIITEDGIKVIEYNCRFGDPEAQVVLPLLETDLLDIMLAIYDEKLKEIDIKWNDGAAACVIMASGGYPVKYNNGYEITGLDENGQLDNARIYHAGTKYENGSFYTAGGRVLGVTSVGESLTDALTNSYDAVNKVNFEGAHFRTDIGKKAMSIG